jgi:succinoglycan biosynthesis transport protein ExoP
MATAIDPRLVTLTAPDTFAAERYQGLRLKLEQLRAEKALRVIAVTSPGAGDGKTLTSINLAGVLARESDAKILLIDADLRRSSVSVQLGIDAGTPGLADLIAGPPSPTNGAGSGGASSKGTLTGLIRRPHTCGFDVLPAGSSSRSVQKLFRAERFTQIIAEARERYDYVLLDTPPLVPVYDAAVLARQVDGVILVVAAGKTPRKLLGAALDLLDASKVVGLVFNDDTSPLFGYSDRAYRPYFTSARA